MDKIRVTRKIDFFEDFHFQNIEIVEKGSTSQHFIVVLELKIYQSFFRNLIFNSAVTKIAIFFIQTWKCDKILIEIVTYDIDSEYF